MTSSGQPAVPPLLSFVSLATHDVARLRAFYAGWGWAELPGGDADFAQFSLGTTRFALYRADLLQAEAAADLAARPADSWSGVTLAVNLRAPDDVDATYAAAVRRGATAVAEPVQRDWGGRSAYVADPEGNRWEIAWLPGMFA